MSVPRLLEDIHGQPESLRMAAEGVKDARRLAEAIRTAGSVVLTGMGSSLYAGMVLSHALCELGIVSRAVETAELLHFPHLLRAGELVILISRSGETVEVLELMGRGGIDFAAVTSEPASSLARGCALTMCVRHRPDELVAVQSYTATVLALLGLASVLSTNEAEFLRRVEAALEALPGYLAEQEEASMQWKEFLAPAGCVYLLGRGPSLASAMEGGLLLHEVSKQPAAAVSAANFRHGPVEVAGERLRAFLFASQMATRDLDRALAGDLIRFGSFVQVIEPPVEPWLAPVFETIPVQFAALRLAEWRGVPLGHVQLASQVTRAEDRFRPL